MKPVRQIWAGLRPRLGLTAATLVLVAALGFLGYRTYEYRREAAQQQHPVVTEARVLLAGGEPEKALALLSTAHGQDPENTEIGLEYAAVLHVTGDYARAEATIEGVLQLKPGWPKALCLRGMIRRNAGDLEGGLKDLETAAAADPDNAPVLYALAHGLLLRRRHGRQGTRAGAADLTRALSLLERAVELAPKQPEYLTELARLYGVQKQWPAAVKAYRRLADLLPDAPEPLVAAAKCYLRSGEAEQAAQMARTAAQRDPHHFPAYEQLARALRLLPVESVDAEEYKRALRSWWDESGAMFSTPAGWLAEAYQREGNLKAAEATLREAIEDEQDPRRPPDCELHAQLGRLLRELGRTKEANAQFVIARRLHEQWDPIGGLLNRIQARPAESRDERLETARRLRDLGWPQFARKLLKPLLETEPPDAEAKKLARELGYESP